MKKQEKTLKKKKRKRKKERKKENKKNKKKREKRAKMFKRSKKAKITLEAVLVLLGAVGQGYSFKTLPTISQQQSGRTPLGG